MTHSTCTSSALSLSPLSLFSLSLFAREALSLCVLSPSLPPQLCLLLPVCAPLPHCPLCCCSTWLYMGIVVDFLVCLRLTRYMRIHIGLKAFYQVRSSKSRRHPLTAH